ncbi:unnamed protein product [Citrullus colocynthis]|uniref:Uncharacterized protein n=1 Tax=Citrullus colocynthis TaxID=252529 RepID=A0ABP0Y8K4_9ROSI
MPYLEKVKTAEAMISRRLLFQPNFINVQLFEYLKHTKPLPTYKREKKYPFLPLSVFTHTHEGQSSSLRLRQTRVFFPFRQPGAGGDTLSRRIVAAYSRSFLSLKIYAVVGSWTLKESGNHDRVCACCL